MRRSSAAARNRRARDPVGVRVDGRRRQEQRTPGVWFGGGAAPSAELDFTALLGCLVVTFSVIGLGYVAQRTGFFDRNTKAGLGQFVGKVALPALLFKAISTLELGSIDPAFIAGVGLCKATAFVLVLILAKLMRRSLSECAIWAVFVSNSNDIALGYPVFLTLYPPFAHQIFITASLQIGLINPLAIILMEYDATRRRGRAISTVDLALRVGWQTLRNPLVLMVLAGAGANWLWAASPPPILVGPQGLFTVLGNAFMAVALVLTGAGGAAARTATPRRDRGSSGGGGGGGGGGGSGGGLSRLGVSAFLTVVTTLVYPMLCRAFVSLLVHRSFWATGIAEQPLKGSGGGGAAATVGPKLLDLTFLYGTLPTAPSTVVIAQAAGEVIAGEIAAAAVFNMVVAAPLAFTSTVLMTVRSLDSLRRAVRMFSELCLGGTAVGAFWVLLTTAAAARAAAADGGGGSGGVSGGGGGGAALGRLRTSPPRNSATPLASSRASGARRAAVRCASRSTPRAPRARAGPPSSPPRRRRPSGCAAHASRRRVRSPSAASAAAGAFRRYGR